MMQLAKLLLVTLGFGALGLLMSLVPQKNATGAGAAPVNIVSSIPLSVSGNVNAAQSGTWTVGVNNFPAFPSSLNVGNIATTQTGSVPNILLVREVDDTALQPFQQQATLAFVDGSLVGNLTGEPIGVPSGKRLILDYLAANGFVPTGNRFTVELETFFNNNLTAQEIASTGAVTVGGSDLVTLSQPLHIYADGPSGIIIEGSRSNSSGNLQATLLLSGHLVDIP